MDTKEAILGILDDILEELRIDDESAIWDRGSDTKKELQDLDDEILEYRQKIAELLMKL